MVCFPARMYKKQPDECGPLMLYFDSLYSFGDSDMFRKIRRRDYSSTVFFLLQTFFCCLWSEPCFQLLENGVEGTERRV